MYNQPSAHLQTCTYTAIIMGRFLILNEPVLLLNVTYEPLNVTTMRRALTLILSGKANIVINGRGVVRTQTAV